MRDFSKSSLLSFMLKSFQLSGLLRRPITAIFMPNGELKALKPHQVESFTAVLTAGQVKNGIVEHGLYNYQELYFCVPSFR